MWTKVAFQTLCRSVHHDPGGETLRIDVRDRRRIEQIGGSAVFQRLDIMVEIPRISREVLGWRELCRIYKNADHRPVRVFASFADERKVACMQRTHGRNKRDP